MNEHFYLNYSAYTWFIRIGNDVWLVRELEVKYLSKILSFKILNNGSARIFPERGYPDTFLGNGYKWILKPGDPLSWFFMSVLDYR